MEKLHKWWLYSQRLSAQKAEVEKGQKTKNEPCFGCVCVYTSTYALPYSIISTRLIAKIKQLSAITVVSQLYDSDSGPSIGQLELEDVVIRHPPMLGVIRCYRVIEQGDRKSQHAVINSSARTIIIWGRGTRSRRD